MLDELPSGCRAFRSPIEKPDAQGRFTDPRVFYVFDNHECRFEGNAYELASSASSGRPSSGVEPGISFFDREDQQHLFKLHLPYVWRTPDSIDTLFAPLVNRRNVFGVQSGLVETDWYPSPVNLILGKPGGSVHVQIGEPLAQAIFIPRNLRRPELEIAADHSRASRDGRRRLAEWDQQHAADRSAYKRLARSRHGASES